MRADRAAEFDVRVHVLPTQDATFAEALLAGALISEGGRMRRGRAGRFDATALVGLIGLRAFAGVATD